MDLTTYYNLLRFLDNETHNTTLTKQQQKQLQQQSKHFVIQNGLLYKINWRKDAINPLWVLKETEIEAVMKGMHKDPLSGHFEYNGTYQRIAIWYW